MNKIAYYLQEHLLGEVTASPDVRRHFAHDGSVLQAIPTVVVYPRNEDDVRKCVRFVWQLAQRGKFLPITARGSGTATTGSAIGHGIILAFSAHMDGVDHFDIKKRALVVQPGITYAVMQRMLKSHGLFLPPTPALPHYTTVGGAIACDAVSQESVKYGSTGGYVQSLRVVLSNGEVIETGTLSKKELNHKMGLQTLEGTIYRALDKLIEESGDFIMRCREAIKARHNSSGYNLFDVKTKNEFNLTPLLIGSEGTLGIITQATMQLAAHSPKMTSVLVSLDEMDDMTEVLAHILELSPSRLDMLNQTAIEQVKKLNPSQLSGVPLQSGAAIHFFVEFDNLKDSDRKKAKTKLQKIAGKFGAWYEIDSGWESLERHRKLYGSVSTILTQPQGQSKAIPIAEDICVPVDKLLEFMTKAEIIYGKVDLPPAMWGQAGSGVVRMQPPLDLSQTGDRQKLFKLQGGLYSLAVSLGGSISAGNGDGRIRAPYISLQYGEGLHKLMLQVKKIFDPKDILNPGVKTATPDEIKKLLRTSYDSGRFADHPPVS